jgi:uncharacterized phage-associated protein
MHVIKLTYIAHGYYLGFTDNPLIGEAVVAWKYGPVIPTIYHSFKKYGSGKVEKLECEVDFQSQEPIIITPITKDVNVTPMLDSVFGVYAKFSALQLSALTHQQNTPWDITFREKGEGAIIANEVIRDHYKDKINANKPHGTTTTSGGTN